MARLVDQLRGDAPRPSGDGYNPPGPIREGVLRHLAQQLDEAEVFVIDNVSEYWDAHSAKRPFRLEDYPNVAPPFGNFFMEWAITDEAGRRFDRDARVGILFTVLREDADDGWLVEASPFLGARDGPIGPIDVLYIVVDPSGRLTDLRGPKDPGPVRSLEMASGHWRLVLPALLGICFLHCRNVVQRMVRPDPKVDRSRARRGRRPFRRYKVLEIEPMTRVLATEGAASEGGLARALHICRGHFKTYDERPLFGSLRGTWWWSDHVRGAIEAGILDKDYAVEAPEASPAEAGAAAARSRGTRSRD